MDDVGNVRSATFSNYFNLPITDMQWKELSNGLDSLCTNRILEEIAGIGFDGTFPWFQPKSLITCLIKCGCDSLIFPSFLLIFTPNNSSMLPSSITSRLAFLKYLITCSIYFWSGLSRIESSVQSTQIFFPLQKTHSSTCDR